MVDDLKFWGTYAVLVMLVLIVGWRQPLRYRFMTKEEIAAYEAPPSTPIPAATPWMWDEMRANKLERGAYKDRPTRVYNYSR